MLREEPLNPRAHDREGFCSGVEALDQYLRRYATQHANKGISVTRILCDDGDPVRIIGYYSLSAAEINLDELPSVARRSLPHHPIPCFRLARLAVDQGFQGQGIGRTLLGLAVDRCLEAKKHVAAFAIIVDATNEVARSFYLHYGFRALPENPLFCYLPLGPLKNQTGGLGE